MELVDADATRSRREHCKPSGHCSTTAAHWLKASRHLRRRLSLTHGTIRPRAAWPRFPASVRSTASLIAATVADIGVFKGRQDSSPPGSVWSAATALYRRQDPAWSDHQSGQPGDNAQCWSSEPRRCVNRAPHWNSAAGVWLRSSGTPPGEAGNRGTGEQNGAHHAWALTVTRKEVYRTRQDASLPPWKLQRDVPSQYCRRRAQARVIRQETLASVMGRGCDHEQLVKYRPFSCALSTLSRSVPETFCTHLMAARAPHDRPARSL